jgi:hypothetical protein
LIITSVPVVRITVDAVVGDGVALREEVVAGERVEVPRLEPVLGQLVVVAVPEINVRIFAAAVPKKLKIVTLMLGKILPKNVKKCRYCRYICTS